MNVSTYKKYYNNKEELIKYLESVIEDNKVLIKQAGFYDAETKLAVQGECNGLKIAIQEIKKLSIKSFISKEEYDAN